MSSDPEYAAKWKSGRRPSSDGSVALGAFSIFVPCLAYCLTLLAPLGFKDGLFFAYFPAPTRAIGAGTGILLGIAACFRAPNWRQARLGFIGIAVGFLGLIGALLLAIPKEWLTSR